MTIRRGKRKEGARGMVNPDEGRIGDKVVGLRAAIVGMGAPGNVGQEAGGMTQTLVFLVFLEMCRRRTAGSSNRKAPPRARARASAAD